MSQLWSRDYLEARLLRSECLARKATLPDMKRIHMRFASHYRRIIEALAA